MTSRNLVGHLRGRSRITQQDEEICRVSYDLAEYLRRDADGQLSEFEGTLELAGGVLLNPGLPDLVLELSDGIRLALEISGVRGCESGEMYEVKGRPAAPKRIPRGYTVANRPGS